MSTTMSATGTGKRAWRCGGDVGGWRLTGYAEAEGGGVGGEEAFEEGGLARTGGAREDDWAFLLRRCRREGRLAGWRLWGVGRIKGEVPVGAIADDGRV